MRTAWGWIAIAIAAAALAYVLPPSAAAAESWLHPRSIIFVVTAGLILYIISLLRGINHRALAAKIDAERARHSLQLLSTISNSFAVAADAEAVLQQVLYFANRELSDWCAIHLLGSDGQTHCAAVGHRSPEMNDLLKNASRLRAVGG